MGTKSFDSSSFYLHTYPLQISFSWSNVLINSSSVSITSPTSLVHPNVNVFSIEMILYRHNADGSHKNTSEYTATLLSR